MSKELNWNDDLVAEYGQFYHSCFNNPFKYLSKNILEEFKNEYSLKPIKDYEVISYIKDGSIQKTGIIRYSVFENALWDIHSVKLLRTSEIFTLGDICKKKDMVDGYPIKYFTVPNTDSKGLWVRCENENKLGFGDWLSNIEKVKAKEKLFTTEDGVDIFKGDIYWFVTNMFDVLYEDSATEYISIGNIRFSTREKAREYVLMNKPCLSVNDIDYFFNSWVVKPNDYVLDKIKYFAKQRIENK